MDSRCIAYDDDGAICGQPAMFVDEQRGGMVCEAHDPGHQKPAPRTRTREEIEFLKGQWLADPDWNIEETEGYELHRDELLEFRKRTEGERLARAEAELKAKLESIGIPDNPKLGEYVLGLERKLLRLESALERAEDRFDRMIERERERTDSSVRGVRGRIGDLEQRI